MFNKIKSFFIKRQRIINLIINIGFIVFNLVLGIYYKSVWYFNFMAYFIVLLLLKIYNDILYKKDYLKYKKISYIITGLTFILMSGIVVGIEILTLNKKMNGYNQIIVITMATYAFYKIILSIIKHKKSSKYDNSHLYIIRSITLVEAIVSILNLTRNMLSAFSENGGENLSFNNSMNLGVGLAGAFVVFLLGFIIIIKGIKTNSSNVRDE